MCTRLRWCCSAWAWLPSASLVWVLKMLMVLTTRRANPWVDSAERRLLAHSLAPPAKIPGRLLVENHGWECSCFRHSVLSGRSHYLSGHEKLPSEQYAQSHSVWHRIYVAFLVGRSCLNVITGMWLKQKNPRGNKLAGHTPRLDWCLCAGVPRQGKRLRQSAATRQMNCDRKQTTFCLNRCNSFLI